MEELKERFPNGVDYAVVYDTTPFINESIVEVFKTLLDATLLVALVVLVFLQNWRSAVIPLIAVPVAIIGTFAVMAAVGFSLNNLTLFGLVLAIGIVVDDAIVVVEAVERHIEAGMTPRDATIQAMREVSGPVVAVGLVLSAVFVPCAFISGIVGLFFRQFAVTIAVSTLISAFNSLTLSPALSALLLKSHHDSKKQAAMPWPVITLIGTTLGFRFISLNPSLENWRWEIGVVIGAAFGLAGGLGAERWVNAGLGWFFPRFNRGFGRATEGYTNSVSRLLRSSGVVLVVYGGLIALTYFGFTHTPSGFIPPQDKGYLLVNVQLPDAASVARTEEVMRQIDAIAGATPGVSHTVALAGQSLLVNANAPNFGSMYVMLDDFHRRHGKGLSGAEIADRLRTAFREQIGDGLIDVFGAPPVEGLSTAGGFKIVIEDRGNYGVGVLESIARDTVARGNAMPELTGLYTSYRASTPWLFLDIDRQAAKSRGISMADVFNTLQVYFGSYYVNDFNRFGRTWQVNVQASPDFRKHIDDLKQLKVRNDQGGMVPLGSITGIRDWTGPVMVVRYNMYASAAINGDAAPGVSSGEAIDKMAAAANQDLPPAMRAEWTELALLQLQAGSTAMLAFILAVVLVFLVLAAQYESWSLPLAVILVVPLCLLCAIAGVQIGRSDINIFTQVGFIVLVGLACKNAILIVEFAKQKRDSGAAPMDATLEAVRLRLRPIIMTSFAFIIGVIPLMVATGAGAEMRRTLGVAVFAGMLGVTLFGIFLTPVFYYVIQWLSERKAVES
jgi:hydrophobe/amphiphile efflux-1 (HAE1) family protein